MTHAGLRLPGGGPAGADDRRRHGGGRRARRRRAPAARRLLPDRGRRRRTSAAACWVSPGRAGAAGCASRDLVALTQQLATLVEAGLPLDRALAILDELAPTPARCAPSWPTCCTACRAAPRWPRRSAKHQPRPFSRLYINMVRAGEKGGVLETTLRRLAEFLEESQAFREALVSALIYPLLLTGVGAAAVVFLMTFVIPRFAAIFADLGADHPAAHADPPRR